MCVPALNSRNELSVSGRVEVWRVVLDESIDYDREEMRGELAVVAVWLRDNVDERGEVGREDGISWGLALVVVQRS